MAKPVHDPTKPDLGLPWHEWADGRLYRLKRGKHFRADSVTLKGAAKAAAENMGKAVRTSRDRSGKFDYLWVQFADAAIFTGQPCVCGHTELVRTHKAEAHCPNCRRTLVLSD